MTPTARGGSQLELTFSGNATLGVLGRSVSPDLGGMVPVAPLRAGSYCGNETSDDAQIRHDGSVIFLNERTPIIDPRSDRWVGVAFTNPVSGERIEVLQVDPGRIGPPRHIHPHQQEHFTVEEGRLTVFRDDDTLELSPGESVTVPAGHAHGFENRTDVPVVFTGWIQPAAELLHALSTLFGLARDGKTRADGTPRFLQAMVFAQAIRDSMYLASPPRPVQEALWTLFAPVGRLLGYQATYDRYLRPDFWEQPGNSTG